MCNGVPYGSWCCVVHGLLELLPNTPQGVGQSLLGAGGVQETVCSDGFQVDRVLSSS